MNDILVDKNGYEQFLEELEKLKSDLLNNAVSGSEAYRDAIGDGWHDNFAFEESMRIERNVTSKIEKMLNEKQRLKIVEMGNYDKQIIDINDILKVQIKYDENDIEDYTLKLTGKYLPSSKNEFQEISLNSPIGKALYLKNINDKLFYTINDKVIEINVLQKYNLQKNNIDDII